MFSDEYENLIIVLVDLKDHPVRLDVKMVPQSGYDSLYMTDYMTMFDYNGGRYWRHYQGKRFGTDSIELRMFLKNTDTYAIDDTSRVMLFRRK